MLQRGLMMDRPLLISAIIEHAAAQFGDTAIVSRETHGAIFRYTYAECAVRVRRLANALRHLGLDAGTSVASIAWNNHRHLEAYYAVSGSGMVITGSVVTAGAATPSGTLAASLCISPDRSPTSTATRRTSCACSTSPITTC